MNFGLVFQQSLNLTIVRSKLRGNALIRIILKF